MSSQSSYVTNEHPSGLGLMAIRPRDPMDDHDREIVQPVDRYPSGGSVSTVLNLPTVMRPVLKPSPAPTPAPIPKPNPQPTPIQPSTPKPVAQPGFTTTSAPQTGGRTPIVNPPSKSGEGYRTSFVQVDGDGLVINGTHRVSKKQVAIIGGGVIGGALLLKIIL